MPPLGFIDVCVFRLNLVCLIGQPNGVFWKALVAYFILFSIEYNNRPFPRSMRSQGKRPGCGSRQAYRQRSRFQRMTLRYETLMGHYFIFKFDFSWVTMTNMDKTEGIFLNLQCDCHRVASIFTKTDQSTYQFQHLALVLSCLVRYSAAPPFVGCQMTANGVSRRG